MNHKISIIRLVWVAVAVGGLLVGARLTTPAAASGESGWSVVSSPNPSAYADILNAVAAVSASDVWAVGSYYNSQKGVMETLIEHWDSTSWSVVPSPNANTTGANILTGVAAVSASDVWAVGYYYNSSLPQTLIEHWNGAYWSIVPSPNPSITGQNVLTGVAAVSAAYVWGVGYYQATSGALQTLIEHWDGTSWNVVSSPNPSTTGNILNGVAAISADDAWAVGSYYDSQKNVLETLTEHWDGTKWTAVSSPSPGAYAYNILTGVAAASASDVWTVGYFQSSNGALVTLIEHWNGRKWSVVSSPNLSGTYGSANILRGVAVLSTEDLWAVGHYQNYGTNQQHQTLTEHWNGASWSIVSSPNAGKADDFNGVATLSGSDVWAVGIYSNYGNDYYNNFLAPQTLVLKR